MMLLVTRFPGFLSIAIVLACALPVVADDSPVSFRRDIAPLLRDRCLACHCDKKAEGGYRVDSFVQLMKAGDSEETPIEAKQPDASELLRRLEAEDESERMPAESASLEAAETAKFRRWIAAGAKYDGEDGSEPIVTIVVPSDHPAAPRVYRRAVPVTALAFVRRQDSLELISGGYRELLVWNPADGSSVRRIGNVPPRIHDIAVRGTSAELVVAGGEPGRMGEVRLIDAASGKTLAVPLVRGDVVLSVAVEPRGSRVAVGASDGSVSLVESDGKTTRWSVEAHKDWVSDVTWSPDGKSIASASFDQQAKVFAVEDGRERVVFAEHKRPIWSLAFSSDGGRVYTGDESGRIVCWSVNEAKKVSEFRGSGSGYELLVDGDTMFLASANRRVMVFDLKTSKPSRQWTGTKGRVISVAFDAASRQVAAGTDRGEIWVWSLETGKQVAQWENRAR